MTTEQKTEEKQFQRVPTQNEKEEEEMITIPKKMLQHSTLVVKPEKIEVKKEKKPRTEKQIEATRRMREALEKRREGGKQEYGVTKHSPEYKESIQKAEEQAEKLAEETGVKVVVKKQQGRPKGSKTIKEAPTPAYVSEEDEEEEDEPPQRKVEAKKPVVIKNGKKQNLSRPLTYLERLNAHLY